MKTTTKLAYASICAFAGLSVFLGAGNVSAIAQNNAIFVEDQNIFINSGQKSDSSGKVTYNAGTKTLTINGADVKTIYTNMADLKIQVDGNNTIAEIFSSGDLTFNGSGKITCPDLIHYYYPDYPEYGEIEGSTEHCIYSNGNQTYNGPTIEVDKINTVYKEIGIGSDQSITINSGTINFTGTDATPIYAADVLTVNGGTLNAYSILLSNNGAKFLGGEISIKNGISTTKHLYPVFKNYEWESFEKNCMETEWELGMDGEAWESGIAKCGKEYTYKSITADQFPTTKIILGNNMGIQENVYLEKYSRPEGNYYSCSPSYDYYLGVITELKTKSGEKAKTVHIGKKYTNKNIDTKIVKEYSTHVLTGGCGSGPYYYKPDIDLELVAKNNINIDFLSKGEYVEIEPTLTRITEVSFIEKAVPQTEKEGLQFLDAMDITLKADGKDITEAEGGFDVTMYVPELAQGFKDLVFVPVKNDVLDFANAIKAVVENGKISAHFPHFSNYVLAASYEKADEEKEEKETVVPTTPNTGSELDGGKTIAIVALSVLPTTLVCFYVAKYIKDRRLHRVKF